MSGEKRDVTTDVDDLAPLFEERAVVWHRCSGAAAPEALIEWTQQVATRVEVAGGELLGRLGSSVVCSFDPIELEDAIELALSLIRCAQEREDQLRASLGIAVGEMRVASFAEGAVLDRAQTLANKARDNELLLDRRAQELASGAYLFSRQAGSGTERGHAVDHRYPRVRDCREAVQRLHDPGLAPANQSDFLRLQELLKDGRGLRVVLRSEEPSTPLEWIERVSAQQDPGPARLHLGRQSGSLEPLGGLQLALRRRYGTPASLEQALSDGSRQSLTRVMGGRPVSRSEATAAVSELLRLLGEEAPVWIVLERLHEIDAASLGVVATAVHVDASDSVLLMPVSTDAKMPPALVPRERSHEFRMAPLKSSDRRAVAETVLGVPPGSDVARRVAALGGDSARGVFEAARTLVSAGDVVHDGAQFVWRAATRGTHESLPVETLLAERVAGLESDAHRLLEVLCIVPPRAPMSLLQRVLELDGVPEEALDSGRDELLREGWVDKRDELGPAATRIRAAVRSNMPPARAAELNRFAAAALADTTPEGFALAAVAHFQAQGGQEPEAAHTLLLAAVAANEHGFERMAVRLAAVAIQLDDSPDIRQAAQGLARRVQSTPAGRKATPLDSQRPPGTDAPDDKVSSRPAPASIADDAIQASLRAFGRGDFDAIESLLDTAQAAGWSRSAAQRLRSLCRLGLGDVQGAQQTLQLAQGNVGQGSEQAKLQLTEALIQLETGATLPALRSGLHALATCRRLGDRKGEAAGLHLLEGCYRRLGRAEDADALAAAARALQAA